MTHLVSSIDIVNEIMYIFIFFWEHKLHYSRKFITIELQATLQEDDSLRMYICILFIIDLEKFISSSSPVLVLNQFLLFVANNVGNLVNL
jgi:hypothetical protein